MSPVGILFRIPLSSTQYVTKQQLHIRHCNKNWQKKHIMPSLNDFTHNTQTGSRDDTHHGLSGGTVPVQVSRQAWEQVHTVTYRMIRCQDFDRECGACMYACMCVGTCMCMARQFSTWPHRFTHIVQPQDRPHVLIRLTHTLFHRNDENRVICNVQYVWAVWYACLGMYVLRGMNSWPTRDMWSAICTSCMICMSRDICLHDIDGLYVYSQNLYAHLYRKSQTLCPRRHVLLT